LSSVFYAVANSSSICAAKPDQEYFEAALALAGVGAESALLIDDTPENVWAAEAMGIQAHLFQSPALMEQFLQQHHALVTA